MTETREKYKLLYRRLWHIIEISDIQESLIDDAEYLISHEFDAENFKDRVETIEKELLAANHIIHNISDDLEDIKNTLGELYLEHYRGELSIESRIEAAYRYKGGLIGDS